MNGEQKTMPLFSILCVLVFDLFAAVLSELVEVPSNAVILEQNAFSSIDMACRSDYQHRLKWNVRENDDSVNDAFYNGFFLREDAKSYCTVITDEPMKCYLRLSNSPQVAKTYVCVEPGSLRETSADLIWIKGDPVCNDNSVEDLTNLTCSVDFRGNWAPTMEWKEHNSHDEKVLSVGVDTLTVSNQRVTSTLVMPEQKGSRNYTCTTKFDISAKPRSTTATNVPDYFRVWIAPVLPTTEDGIVEGNPTNEKEDRKHILLKIIIGTTCASAIAAVGLLLITAVVIRVIRRRRVSNDNRKHGPINGVDTHRKAPKEAASQMEYGQPDSKALLKHLMHVNDDTHQPAKLSTVAFRS